MAEGLSDQGPAGISMSEQIARYLKVLRRRWPVIVAFPLIAMVVALVVGLSEQKKYDATAKLVVNPTNQVTAVLNPSANTQSADPERDLNTEVSLITTVPLAEAVRHQLHLQENHDDLLAQVRTSIEGTTNIVEITVRDPDPERAARVANEFANQYIVARDTQARSAFQQAADQARAELGALSPAQRKGAAGLQLRSRLQELVVDSTLQTGNAHVVQPATPPTSAATPKLKFDLALGLLLGLILGVAAAAVLELLDRRLKDEDDVVAIAPFSVLGTIPGSRRSGQPRPLEPELERVEAYRSLATGLRFLKVGDQVKTLMITSPGSRVGKTSVTLSLAVALAEFGQRVIAVECDLRQPRFAEYLELPSTGGLSSVLGGWTTCSRELVELDVPSISDGSPRLSVLPCGPTPPNPHALLTGSELAEVLQELRSTADVVLIDTPPLGPLADVVPLIPRMDGVALVVGLRQTTRDELRRARNLLEEFQAPVLGTILTSGKGSLGGLAQAWRKTDSPSPRAHVTVARSA